MLEIKRLNVHYGKQHVVKNIDLDVKPGEVVVLIGPNAAGKSTTLRTLAGLKRHTSGSIDFDGQSLDAIPTTERVRRGVVLVPEGRQIFTRFTVFENLQMGAYHRADRNTIDADIEEVFAMFPRLQERRTQKAGSMSGGEQQMLAIGRGLMAKPKIMLLDEPTLGLAPIVIDELGKIVRKLASAGMGILLAEQNAAMALGCADRAYALESGAVELSGTAEEISKTPKVQQMYLGH
jgi:branched-chain amino acid transport system ATP-binding protein